MSSSNPISITRLWTRLKLELISAEYAKAARAIMAWPVKENKISQKKFSYLANSWRGILCISPVLYAWMVILE